MVLPPGVLIEVGQMLLPSTDSIIVVGYVIVGWGWVGDSAAVHTVDLVVVGYESAAALPAALDLNLREVGNSGAQRNTNQASGVKLIKS